MNTQKTINIFISVMLLTVFAFPDKALSSQMPINSSKLTFSDSLDDFASIYGSFAMQQANPDTWGIISENRSSFTKVVDMTAYSSTPDQTDDTPFITASNTHVRDGIVATNALKFGTKIKIPAIFGDKIFVVEDRMNRRYTDRVDIWFKTREEARQFGLRRAEIVVLY